MKNLNYKKVALLLIGVDILMIVLHLLFGEDQGLFDLDWERNIPSLYQSIKLILAGTLVIANAVVFLMIEKEKKKRNAFLGLFGFVVVLLGIDEGVEIHEVIPYYFEKVSPVFYNWYRSLLNKIGFESSIWIPFVALLSPIALILFFVYIKTAIEHWGKKRIIVLASIFIFFFAGAIGIEFLATTDVVFFSPSYKFWMTLEESIEMIGASMLFAFVFQDLELTTKIIRKNL